VSLIDTVDAYGPFVSENLIKEALYRSCPRGISRGGRTSGRGSRKGAHRESAVVSEIISALTIDRGGPEPTNVQLQR
jgi:hypothetical protein